MHRIAAITLVVGDCVFSLLYCLCLPRSRFDIKDDMRDFLLVAGVDPYAFFKPMQEFTKPFLRSETAPAGSK